MSAPEPTSGRDFCGCEWTLVDGEVTVTRCAMHEHALDLLHACEAVLLFHGGSPWDAAKAKRWDELGVAEDVTTRGLCDFVRGALAKARGESKSPGAAAVPKMTAAIAAALDWFHDPDADAIEEFERIGAMYQRDTGFLRPGKDEPAETGRDSNSEENRTRWALWCAEQSRRVLGMLRDAAKAAGA